ncbi:unnamed protein product [Arctogadus glacialis]
MTRSQSVLQSRDQRPHSHTSHHRPARRPSTGPPAPPPPTRQLPPTTTLHPHSSVSLSHRALPPAPPPSPSTAITNGATPIASPNVGVVVSDTQPSHPTTRGHSKKPIAPLSRTTSSPGTLLLAHRPTSPAPCPSATPKTNPGDAQTGPLGGVPVAQSTGAPAVQKTPVRRALFTPLPSHPPVRRSKSEGHVLVPEVCTDATMNDRLWSKVDPGSHRDSMSSSSSISSSDTLLPLLLRRRPPYDGSPVAKSKSNPNLWPGASRPDDELQPRPLGTPRGEPPRGDSPLEDSPAGLTQRRTPGARLYMDGLEAAVVVGRRQEGLAGRPAARPRLLHVQEPGRPDVATTSPATSTATTSPPRPATRPGHRPPRSQQQQQQPEEEEPLARRTSSRSQSRVRYIANRAKQAQERQRAAGPGAGPQREHRQPHRGAGEPEGACCVARSPCTSHDPLGQLAGLRAPVPRPLSAPPDPDNKEVFFMLKL